MPFTSTSQLRSTRALTLVEVMVALVVSLVAVVGLLQAAVMGTEMLDLSRKQTIATQILRTQIEQLRLSTWTTVSALPAGPTTITTVYGGSPTVATGFTVKRTVAAVAGKSNFKLVTFTVSWTGYLGRTYTRTALTYASKNGLNSVYQR